MYKTRTLFKSVSENKTGSNQKKKMKQRKKDVKKNLCFWIPVKKNKIHVAPKDKYAKIRVTFQAAIRVNLIIGQFFSLIPVSGILSDNPYNVRFHRYSWKCLYSLLSLFGQTYMTILCLLKVLYFDASLNATPPVFFYGSSFITMIMFYQVGARWPILVQAITKTEEADPNFDPKLMRKVNGTCAIILSLALFEHILSLISAYSGAMACDPNYKDLYESFVKHFYPWVFKFLPYSLPLGIITQWLHFQSTFVWNFSDLYVISMSYYLTSRLEQINNKMLAAQGKIWVVSPPPVVVSFRWRQVVGIYIFQYLPEVFWRITREDYCRVTQLVRKVDDVISGIIFISFANNLFFICLQLFNSLEDGIKGTGMCSSRAKGMDHSHILGGYESVAYFLFSLVFLISRSVAVSLIASQVHSASTVPAAVLYDVPSPVYCVEVQRFLDQVNGDKIALSGLQFFSVTRGLLLTVAGTIVTYELVMFQFNSSPDSGTPSSTALPILSTTPIS